MFIVSWDMPFLCSSFGVLSKSICKLASLACFNKTCNRETQGLLCLHILCMVSFLPFGECGQHKFHTLTLSFLALLYGTVYTVEAFACTVWSWFFLFVCLIHSSPELPLIMIRVSFCGRWCNKINLFTNTAHYHNSSLPLSFMYVVPPSFIPYLTLLLPLLQSSNVVCLS